ncbi:DNA (cytosine-5-)-methyltransferase [Collinsella sp. D33t1_170424_A12]|uniref:DNA (cytosine-5-)-methyltransferase n=1 Tax=Collinsella sp. D33t1_170424_A12 TaxID=2787135 RepID=UPI0018983D86|nr:DNA (cytosine-5-)-methyltransferase [Collinsella sp. D33t1_170424_A12]
MKLNAITAADAAHLLGVSVDTIRRWDKLGLIKSVRDGRNRRLFSTQELERVKHKLEGGVSCQFSVLRSDKQYETATCIDLFAGAGGTALGFHNAGLNHIYLNELDSRAAETLRRNSESHGLDWTIDNSDVRTVDFAGMHAEVIQAGFPCQAFSYAGKSRGFEDTRGTLFFEFARAIKDVKPKVAIGENVRGLLRHDGGRTLSTMMDTLDQLGYRATYRVLRSQYLDVPQKRERLIIFAIRKDLDIPYVFPKEKDYFISLREALKDCPASEGQSYPEKKKKIMDLIPEGGYWKDLSDDLQREYMGASYFLTGGKTGMARRLSWDQPSLTLTCSPAQKQTERCHPSETRPLTVREYARIQTFPDDWEFCGSMAQKYKQIGNAVPVNLGYHVGRCVLAALGYIPITDDMEVIYPNSN